MTGETRAIHGVSVHGLEVDAQTRCRHYHAERDVIALRFPCCERWYPCFDCHAACTDHAPTVWAVTERHRHAVLCGVCGRQLTITEYLGSESRCPGCGAAFNPGCRKHHHLYFA